MESRNMSVQTTVVVVVAVCVLAIAVLTGSANATAEKEEVWRFNSQDHGRHQALINDEDLRDQANLLMRSMDRNHDHKLTAEDVKASPNVLERHLPGISAEEFSNFLELADMDNDGAVTHEELMLSLATSLDHSSLVEMDARHRRRGFFRSIGRFFRRVFGRRRRRRQVRRRQPPPKKDDTLKISGGDESCVICQYVVERCETNVKQAGVIPANSNSPSSGGIYLEMESKTLPGKKVDERTVLLETDAKWGQEPSDVAGAGIIGSTRQSTRYQRQLERQKYNEIFRVVDITLDDVCEQGMPNAFYQYCKMVYAKQSDIVDGLRYQYRPSDICYRVGMCADGSYVTKGIHSRFNGANEHAHGKKHH